jgi:hypothetical protein
MSNHTLRRALDTGVIAGTSLTSADVDVYEDIYRALQKLLRQ